ncbi:uncharacterized protein LOC129000388 [Macrosteles quadrilineatus]|uniref:uncharacterized protein LOC129000388 n=1 Tax=Macrosteles quadrilineatus TaxID=74068 RepID=UPI0023E2A263|nr:uncharacterized protein LOC129000388 [Macrosteles quadrilineatus]
MKKPSGSAGQSAAAGASAVRPEEIQQQQEALQEIRAEIDQATLRDLQDSLQAQEPLAVRPEEIQQQQEALQEIRAEIDQATLRDLQDSLQAQEHPAVRPEEIQQQQEALQEIRAEIDQKICRNCGVLVDTNWRQGENFATPVTVSPRSTGRAGPQDCGNKTKGRFSGWVSGKWSCFVIFKN